MCILFGFLILVLVTQVECVMDDVSGTAGNAIFIFDNQDICREDKDNDTISADSVLDTYRGCHHVINPSAPLPKDQDYYYRLTCTSFGLAKYSYYCEAGCTNCDEKDVEVGRCRLWDIDNEEYSTLVYTKVRGCLYNYEAIGVWGTWWGFFNLSYLVFCGLTCFCMVYCILGCVWLCCMVDGMTDDDVKYAEF